MLVTSSIKQEEVNNLLVPGGRLTSGMCPAELASEKNQVMDKLLNQPQMPSDYGDVMIGLYRDKLRPENSPEEVYDSGRNRILIP